MVQKDLLCAQTIAAQLPDAFRIQVFQEISSTNTVLKELARCGQAGEKTVLVSDYQTGGKGRLGRSFFSPKGSGLYLSMLLSPKEHVLDSMMLTAQAAVAVYRAVKLVLGIELDIKWVNDLYHQGKKVCGILAEGQVNAKTGMLDFVVIGIGINLYEPTGGFPEELKARAGSILGAKPERMPTDQSSFKKANVQSADSAVWESEDVLEDVFKGSGTAYAQESCRLDRNKLAAELIRQMYALADERELAPEYIARNLVPEKEILVLDGKRSRHARALDILPNGHLRILEEDGRISELVYGEISVRLAENGRQA